MESRRPKLDPNVWEKLPINLLDHVVAFLPIPTQAQFRTVSKHFNTWLSSPELDVLSNELPLKPFVVLWQVVDPAPYLTNYIQIGGFTNLGRGSQLFNADHLRPFMANLLEWDIDIEATTRCFMCISCEAMGRARQRLEKSTQKSNKSIDKVLVFNLTDNDIHEIPSDMALCFADGGSDSNTLGGVLMQSKMIPVHENDCDFRFVNVLVTKDRGTVLMLYDSTTKCSVKFDDVFQGLEHGRRMWLPRLCCATFGRVFIFNLSMGPRRIGYLTSFSYALTGGNWESRMDVDIEIPHCVLSGLYVVQLITTNDCVFVLGLGFSELLLWHVDVAKMEFVECDNFAIVGVLAHHLSFVGSYSDYLVFGPGMRTCPADELGRCVVTGFRVFDLKRKEWRELVQIKDRLISESTSGLDDLHLEYFYDPVVESFNDPQ